MAPAGVIPEAEVSITVDKGVNTSTRDLVLAAISVMKMAADKLPFDVKQCRANVADMAASLKAGGFAELYGPVCADAAYKIGIFVRTKM